MPGILDVIPRNHPVLEDLLVVVDVVQEQVERDNPLGEAGLEVFPLIASDHAGHRIERKDPLGPAVVVVNVEGDAVAEEIQLRIGLAGEEFPGVEPAEGIHQRAAVAADLAAGFEHLVVKGAWVVAGEHLAGLVLSEKQAAGQV